MDRLALSPHSQIRLSLIVANQPQYPIPPVPPSITWPSNVSELGFPENHVPVRRSDWLIASDDRTFNHQIAILRLKTEFSSTYHSEAGGTGGTSGTVGTSGTGGT
jgi:hypothetical protein